MAKWVCKVCGYVHEGDTPPEKCPQCGAPASRFEKVEENKRFIIITTDTNREHIIIKKKLTEEEVKFLQQIKKELNEKQRENNEISNT